MQRDRAFVTQLCEDDGTTLLEVLTVLAILGLISATALGYYRPKPSADIKTQVEDVLSQLKQTRLAALRKGEPTVFVPESSAGIDMNFVPLQGPSQLSSSPKLTFFPDYSATAGTLVIKTGLTSAAIIILPDGSVR